MSDVYRQEFIQVARRAYSMWNRDPASPSCGSFDRLYWGWKYKDFSDATMQYAVSLAVEYAIEIGRTVMLPRLLQDYVAFCGSIQHADGSFDQCYPYERSPGVFYDFLSTFISLHESPYLSGSASRSLLEQIIAKGAAFLLRTDEKHGQVANHILQYAFELLNYARFSGDSGARARGLEYTERALAWFDQEEGWFREYHGADAGYQTRALRYLVKIAAMLARDDLWDTAGRAARFVEQMLMPDGSIHPMLGCRSTALLYPSAFEVLASRTSSFEGLAARVRDAWRRGSVPLPSALDFGNAIRLADDARDAAHACNASAESPPPALPDGNTEFRNAGILIRRGQQRVVYVAYRLGGVVVVYCKDSDDKWRLAAEDSGYLLKFQRDAEVWVTRMPGSGTLVEATDGHIVVEARFFRSLHDELTPLRLLLLRVLNLSFLRWQWVADLFRRRVVKQLMNARVAGMGVLKRELSITDRSLAIVDRIEWDDAGRAARGELFRCRRCSGTHMASARYFQEQELDDVPPGWAEKVSIPVNGLTRHAINLDTKTEH